MSVRVGEVSFLLGGLFYRMATVEVGNPEAQPVICVNGLTRNGRDFDVLLRALASRYRVIAPDLPGRGWSDWLRDGELYQPVTYVHAVAHLLATVGRLVMRISTLLGGTCGRAAFVEERA